MAYIIDSVYLSHLTEHSILKDHFSPLEIKDLSAVLSLRHFRQDDILIKEGSHADSAMILLEGMVHVVINGQRVATMQAGGFLGESAFLDDGLCKATVIARTNGVAAELTKEQFERFIVQRPEVASKYKSFFNTFYHKNKNFNDLFFYKDTCRYVALVAHNDKKAELIAFVSQHRWFFDKYPLVATETTGTAIFQSTGITLSRKVLSGPLGGDQIIGAMVASDNISAVIFFRDALSAHAHHADIEALGRICDIYRVPFATNSGTADAVIMHLSNNKTDQAASQDDSRMKYKQQQTEVV